MMPPAQSFLLNIILGIWDLYGSILVLGFFSISVKMLLNSDKNCNESVGHNVAGIGIKLY